MYCLRLHVAQKVKTCWTVVTKRGKSFVFNVFIAVNNILACCAFWLYRYLDYIPTINSIRILSDLRMVFSFLLTKPSFGKQNIFDSFVFFSERVTFSSFCPKYRQKLYCSEFSNGHNFYPFEGCPLLLVLSLFGMIEVLWHQPVILLLRLICW